MGQSQRSVGIYEHGYVVYLWEIFNLKKGRGIGQT